jgi:hypothetical protein
MMNQQLLERTTVSPKVMDNGGREKEKGLLQLVGFQPVKPLPVCRRSGDGYRGQTGPLSPALIDEASKSYHTVG